jgi:hypothetical protein
MRDQVGASNTNLKSYIQDLKKVAQSNKHKRAVGGGNPGGQNPMAGGGNVMAINTNS